MVPDVDRLGSLDVEPAHGGLQEMGVYTDNTGARRLYERLGFKEAQNEHYLTLSGPALAALKGKT